MNHEEKLGPFYDRVTESVLRRKAAEVAYEAAHKELQAAMVEEAEAAKAARQACEELTAY